MLRNLAAAVALLLLSQTALGLGLGTLKQSSALNQPFDGRIEILGANARDFDTILVKLGDVEQFERAGIQRNAVLLGLKFKVVDGASGADYIKVTSREPIREPFLNFLLELNWAKGRMIREYTVLLDPPLYDPSRRQMRPAPTTSVITPTPLPAPVTHSAPPAIVTPIPSTPAYDPQDEPSYSTYAGGSTIGPVQANDTLWSLAAAHRPGGVSVQQFMLALLRANPNAFGGGNINILKRGAILRIPEEHELDGLSRSDAIAEVQRQHQIWSGYRDTAAEQVAEAPLDSDDDTMTPDDGLDDAFGEGPDDNTEASADDDARLELVVPGGDDEGAGTDEAGASDITLAREELDAQVQENLELQARIAEANEIIDLMSRQVDIKDDELAAMQARLAELGVEAPADVTARAEANVASGEMSDDTATDEDEVVEVDPDRYGDEHVVFTPDEVASGEPSEEIADASGDEEDSGSEGEVDASTVGVVDPVDDTELDDTPRPSSGLIPAHIADMVPGGTKTIFGLLALLGLGILALLAKLMRGRSHETESATIVGREEQAEDTAIDDIDTVRDEPDHEQTVVLDTTGESVAIDQDMTATQPDLPPGAAITVDELTDDAHGEDPLEEVNVYLAYERFDQAEELVRKVVAEHPDEHKYKLRLLEVFYSSNNPVEYEQAAHALHDAVGEDSPLWESAVAMWSEMSPERALFEEGELDVSTSDDDDGDTNAFVDITAANVDEAGNTMSMAPASDSTLDSTVVGLNDPAEIVGDESGLDFDLGGGVDEVEDDILDLTAASSEPLSVADDDVFDLTAGIDENIDMDDVLDITSDRVDTVIERADDALSASVTSDLGDTGALVDLDSPSAGPLDPLDITQANEASTEHGGDLLDLSSPPLSDDNAPTDHGIDISDTAAPSDDSEELSDALEDVFDVTAHADAQVLDFDIGELEDAVADDDDETLEIGDGIDFSANVADTSADGTLEMEIDDAVETATQDDVETVEMEAVDADSNADLSSVEGAADNTHENVEFDLSLKSSDLDEISVEEPVSDAENEIEFDLALQDTTEIERLAIDDTLELPKADAPDESLEELTRSMEESMAGLDLDDGDLEELDDELDLSLSNTNSELDADFSDEPEPTLDFELDDFDTEIDPASTLALDVGGETIPKEQTTVALPVENTVEQQTPSEEVDTKLNLAKAYIELGDKDGARSILDEVASDGTDEQKTEANRLISQL